MATVLALDVNAAEIKLEEKFEAVHQSVVTVLRGGQTISLTTVLPD